MVKSGQTTLLEDAQVRLDKLTQSEFAQIRLYLGIRESKTELVESIKRQIEREAGSQASKPSK